IVDCPGSVTRPSTSPAVGGIVDRPNEGELANRVLFIVRSTVGHGSQALLPEPCRQEKQQEWSNEDQGNSKCEMRNAKWKCEFRNAKCEVQDAKISSSKCCAFA